MPKGKRVTALRYGASAETETFLYFNRMKSKRKMKESDLTIPLALTVDDANVLHAYNHDSFNTYVEVGPYSAITILTQWIDSIFKKHSDKAEQMLKAFISGSIHTQLGADMFRASLLMTESILECDKVGTVIIDSLFCGSKYK